MIKTIIFIYYLNGHRALGNFQSTPVASGLEKEKIIHFIVETDGIQKLEDKNLSAMLQSPFTSMHYEPEYHTQMNTIDLHSWIK